VGTLGRSLFPCLFNASRTRLSSAEEAPHPTRQPAAFGRALVVDEVVGMDGDAGLAQEGAGVVYAGVGDSRGEGSLDEVVAVPPNAVDAQAE
jgi:hypothetical protein